MEFHGCLLARGRADGWLEGVDISCWGMLLQPPVHVGPIILKPSDNPCVTVFGDSNDTGLFARGWMRIMPAFTMGGRGEHYFSSQSGYSVRIV
jgi:hypothetical protein